MMAITANDQRQPSWTARMPPKKTPRTEPNEPPAMNAPVSDARLVGANTISTTARPTLPYAASPRPMKNRASIMCS